MTQEIYSVWRSGDEKAFLFVADDVNGLASAERTGFEEIQFGRATALEGEALPVAEKPDAAEKNSENERECAKNAEDGEAGVRE